MPARKRGREEMEEPSAPQPNGLLSRLRNTWYFANVFQFIQLFGAVLKVDENFDIEDFEEDCLTPGSPKLAEIAHALIKFAAPNWERGQLDQLARREFDRRRPQEQNPFGNKDEEQNEFAAIDIFEKLRILHTITQWVWDDPERLRAKMAKMEEAETSWRIEPFGWDEKERPYYVLDDNRCYRQTPKPQAPPPEPKSKSKAKGKGKSKSKAPPRPVKRGTRRSARGKGESDDEPEVSDAPEDDPSVDAINDVGTEDGAADDGLGGDKWECLAVTLQEYQDLLGELKGSRDYNQKQLHKMIVQHVLPIIEEGENLRAKKIAKRQRELMTLEKLASAKRSSRLAGKADKEREEQLVREAEEKRLRDLAAAKKDAERQKQMEHDRQSRMMTREQRIKDREYKRILHEEELQRLEAEKEKLESGEVDAKKSERQLAAELKKKQEALKELEAEDDWVFDCAHCGVHGKNVDDGKHSIACETCNVWQHSACLGLTVKQAESEDFKFVCDDCKRKEEDAKKPKIAPLRFPANLSSPSQAKPVEAPAANGAAQNGARMVVDKPAQQQKRKSSEANGATGLPPLKKFKPVKHSQPAPPPPPPQTNGGTMHNTFLNGPTLSPQGQVQSPANGARPPGLVSPQRPNHNTASYSPSQPMQFGPPLQALSAQQQGLSNGHSPQKQNPGPRTPASNDPFRNTFAGQTGSAKSQASPLQGQVLPAQDSHRMLPPQSTPTSSFQSNGNGSFQYVPPSTPSVAQKQSAAAPSPAPSTTLQASSPAMAPPHRADAATAGISPVKNSPPRPMSRDVHMSPGVPPAPKLEPSPEPADKPLTGGESPVKSSVPLKAPGTTS